MAWCCCTCTPRLATQSSRASTSQVSDIAMACALGMSAPSDPPQGCKTKHIPFPTALQQQKLLLTTGRLQGVFSTGLAPAEG